MHPHRDKHIKYGISLSLNIIRKKGRQNYTNSHYKSRNKRFVIHITNRLSIIFNLKCFIPPGAFGLIGKSVAVEKVKKRSIKPCSNMDIDALCGESILKNCILYILTFLLVTQHWGGGLGIYYQHCRRGQA